MLDVNNVKTKQLQTKNQNITKRDFWPAMPNCNVVTRGQLMKP